jgi:hypothetical protein
MLNTGVAITISAVVVATEATVTLAGDEQGTYVAIGTAEHCAVICDRQTI